MSKTDFHERLKNTGRNDQCPCGSGKKYKKCHLAEDEAAEFKDRAKKQAEIDAAKKPEEDNEEEKKDSNLKDHSVFKGAPKPKMSRSDKLSNIHRKVDM